MQPPSKPSRPNPRPNFHHSPVSARSTAAVGVGDNSSMGRFHQYRGILLLSMAALVIWMNLTFIVPLTMGAIFAVVLHPLMHKMNGWKVKPIWKSLAITSLFAVSFLLPIGIIIFLGAETALGKINSLRESGLDTSALTPKGLIEFFGLQEWINRAVEVSSASEAQIRQMGMRGILAAGDWLTGVLQGLIASLPKAMFSTVIVLLTVFFLLIDGERAARFIRENSVFGPKHTAQIIHNVSNLCYSVVVASVAAGAVQSSLILFACFITGTSSAILIGFVSFVMSFLPVVGTLPVTAGLTLLAFLQGEFVNGFIFLGFAFLVGLSDNVVRPYVLKGGAELHPLVGFVAAFGAIDAIGFYGVFIGPVVAGLFFALLPMVTRTYGRRALNH